MFGVYFEVMKRSFQQRFIYKVDSYLNTVGAVITLFIQISLWYALMSKNGSINGINFQSMFDYIIINTIVLALVVSNSGNELAKKVQDGSVSIDLIRPIKLKLFLLSQDIGNNFFTTIFTVLPVCLLSIFIFGFRLPINTFSFGVFLLSTINGIIIIFHINYIFGLLAFWLYSTWYIPFYTNALFRLFGGTIVPIWFYPDFLQRICGILPFRLITFVPIEIYIGRITTNSYLQVILTQIIWIIVFILIEKIIWNKAQNKIIIQGG
ncbi:MAG: ABC-2 family transporter protein [Candidatus Pacearchaeota archaeon]|nr:ABC-2 family transporter protein [Candidatus Pacearchaeota archaeon]